jgi:hypothetical protein
MLKLQYLLRHPASTPAADFAALALQRATRLLAHDPAGLKVTYTAADPPRLCLVPFKRTRVALFSIWDDDPAAALRWTERVRQTGAGAWSGYRVTESVPRRYARDWPDGTITPGVGLLTRLTRRRGLSDAEYLRRWHGGHSTLSLEVHPLWGYVRNVIEATVVDGTPPCDGIVEEQFRQAGDLLTPWGLFGGARAMLPNLARVGVDLLGFLDLRALESWLVSERWLRTPPA